MAQYKENDVVVAIDTNSGTEDLILVEKYERVEIGGFDQPIYEDSFCYNVLMDNCGTLKFQGCKNYQKSRPATKGEIEILYRALRKQEVIIKNRLSRLETYIQRSGSKANEICKKCESSFNSKNGYYCLKLQRVVEYDKTPMCKSNNTR